MSRRAAGWLAGSTCAAWFLMVFAVIWQAWRGQPAIDVSLIFALAGYVVVGALVATLRPDNAVGWLLLAIAISLAVPEVGLAYVRKPMSSGDFAAVWFAGWWQIVPYMLALGLLPLVFPDGRLLSPRWRPVVWLGGIALALSIVGAALQPGPLDVPIRVQNPLGVGGGAADAVGIARWTGDTLRAVVGVLAAGSLAVRFRRARGVERQQLKWLVLVALVALAGLLVSNAAARLPGRWLTPAGDIAWNVLLFAFVLGLPAAVGIAILRHRLYDIDLVIKRTLVYGSLTALLVATYLVLVLAFRLALDPLAGESDLAVAGSTLAVAALFRPARSRIQALVDRRLYRSRYDAARTLDGFSARLRDELDLETLGADLRAVVRDTMQPAHVSLWLREARP